jgi:transcription factor SPN1
LKEEAFAFVSSMNEACDADITNNKNSQPALAKIKLLPKVQEMLARLKMHIFLIDCGVLHAVRKWLEPLPDRTLPNIRVRETLLRALEHLPITENHLQESRIGRIVMFLLKNDSETPANKTLAKKLIDKWSRPVFELSSNWMDLQYHDEVRTLRKLGRPAPGAVQPQQQPADDEMLDTKQEAAPPNKKLKVTDFLARMPEKSTMEFTVRPMSAIDPESKGQRQLSATEMLERKLKKTKGSGESRHSTVGLTKANRK